MLKKLVLTGAAGRLGSRLRAPLSALCETLVSTDIVESIEGLASNETYVAANLADLAAMTQLLKDADMVVHFGAIGDEAPWEQIHSANIMGAYNVWEAAYQNGVRRVVYASSIHAVGMHPKSECIGTDAPHRPDTFYGLAKCFAEDLGSLYWDKRGIEAVCMRIYSCAEVANPRAVGSWLSYDDLRSLIVACMKTANVEHSIIFGVSNNDCVLIDNKYAKHIGYIPRDNGEDYRVQVETKDGFVDSNDPLVTTHGGYFASAGHFDDS